MKYKIVLKISFYLNRGFLRSDFFPTAPEALKSAAKICIYKNGFAFFLLPGPTRDRWGSVLTGPSFPGRKGGGEHPKPQPPTKIPPGSPPPPSLPPYGAGPGAGTGRALAAASRAERTRSRGAAASSPPPPAPGSALGGTEPAPSTRRRECGRARRAGWRQWLPNGPATASRPEAGGGGGRLLRLTGLAADKMGGR